MTVLILLIISVLGLYIGDIAMNDGSATQNLMKTVLLLLFLSAMLMHIITMPKRTKKFVKSKYSSEINGAFEDSAEDRSLLIDSIIAYDSADYESAVKTLLPLKSKCKSDTDHLAVGMLLASSLKELKLYDEATFTYEELLRKNIKSSKIYSNLGVIHSTLSQISAAIECFENAIEINPSDRLAYHNLAKLYFDKQDHENAVKYAKSALEINEKTYQSATLLAVIYTLKGDAGNAKKYKALALKGGESKKNLSEVLAFYTV